ncbi:Protein-methionine-sulfoxide reductase heme-binding subunit MsrQ [Candidatus Magnetaquicoccaceae bacterium FCR-1]|uniref:Protein-methionine-sulfoxide reductase heme-binding subunit MsrQ n=1 Tax=Candidatus Magnetaquiglobus chichijimensis TaxID=3141448 RepID=A0ABQ0C4Z5_9PROT
MISRLTWMIGVLPLVWLVARFLVVGPGVNPVETVMRFCGDWSLWWLLATLAVTPARRLPGCGGMIRWRRAFGLSAFFYAVLHLAVYAVLDHGLAWAPIWKDLMKRPYITLGFVAWVLLVPLAITSTRGWMIRLGRYWSRLHRLIYPASLLAVAHHYWMVKADTRLPLVHAAILALLLGWRLVARVRASA